jgi:uncharacterized membrane protein YhaH (DUF805 family)
MNNHINNPQGTKHNTKTIIGFALLGIGALLLLKHASFIFFPSWLFSWPVLLIAFGLYLGAKHDFKKSNWIFLTALGVLFLLTNIIPSLSMGMLWPVMLIVMGAHFITRRNLRWNRDHWERPNDTQYHNFDNNI